MVTIFALLESWTSPAPSHRTNQPPEQSLATSFGGFGSVATSQPPQPLLPNPNFINIFPLDQRVHFSHKPSSAFSPPWPGALSLCPLSMSSNTQFRAIPTPVSLVPLGIMYLSNSRGKSTPKDSLIAYLVDATSRHIVTASST
jgi:hypothetical protein